MKCFQCDKGSMESQVTDVPGKARGEDVTVRCEAMVCTRCGFQVMTDEQSKTYTIASSDAYRKRHGLLTSQDLVQARRRLRLSQAKFASYLSVGVASVKRWETGLIQDEAMDKLIRLKTDLDEARRNIADLDRRLRVEKDVDRSDVHVLSLPTGRTEPAEQI